MPTDLHDLADKIEAAAVERARLFVSFDQVPDRDDHIHVAASALAVANALRALAQDPQP
jgi:hypothetical protein